MSDGVSDGVSNRQSGGVSDGAGDAGRGPHVTRAGAGTDRRAASATRVIAGDIGGTHARLGLFEVAGASVRLLQASDVDSHSVSGLAPLVHEFRRAAGATDVQRACFAIAGAQIDGVWRTPNLPWSVPAATVAADIGIAHTAILNDFEAAGYAIPLLAGDDLVTVHPGTPVPGGPIAVLGAGTGLGMAMLLHDGRRYRVHPSEGGHADYAPRTALECELLGFLRTRHGRVSTERILSGRGLGALYDFVVQRGDHPARPATRLAMTTEDPAAVVTRLGLADTDDACVAALDLFATVYGAAAGNLALTVLATGGVFLGGGIAPRVVAALQGPAFRQAFADKGRLSPLIAQMPVHVMVRQGVGLLGAAAVAAAL